MTKIQLWQNDRNVRFLELKALADTIMNQAAAPTPPPPKKKKIQISGNF